MATTTEINQPFSIKAPVGFDSRSLKKVVSGSTVSYQPFASANDITNPESNDYLPLEYRAVGVPIYINDGSGTKEYQFVNGTADGDFKEMVYDKIANFSNSISAGFKKAGNTVYNLLCQYTGKEFSANKTTTKPGGGSISDSDVDNVIIFKIGTEYFKRNIAGNYDSQIWGLVADGTTDNTAFINAAITAVYNNGKGIIEIPQGTVVIMGQVNMKDGVYLVGKGSGATTIDASNATTTNATFYAAGTVTALPGLSADMAAGSLSMTLASAPSVAERDTVIIHDANNNSYSSARTYYNRGEMFKVLSVSGSTINVTSNAFDTYLAATSNINLYKVNSVTVGISGMTIRFKKGVIIPGIQVSLGKGCQFNDLNLSGNQYGHISLDRCYDTTVNDPRIYDNQSDVGYNYGIAVSNCQRVTISGGKIETLRHAVTFGSGAQQGSVPCRQVQVIGAFLNSMQGQPALDFHGICEHYFVTGCTIPAGVSFGGDRGTLIANKIGNDTASGSALGFAELVGLNFTIKGNEFYASKDFTNFINLQPTSVFTRAGSTFRFTNNDLDLGVFKHPSYPASSSLGVYFAPATNIGTEDYKIVCKGNTIVTTNATAGDYLGIAIIVNGQKGVKNISISNNDLFGAGIRITSNFQNAVIKDNTVIDSLNRGLYVVELTAQTFTNQTAYIRGNTIIGAKGDGLSVYQATAGQTYSRMFIENNTSINNGTGTAGTNSCVIYGVKDLYFRENNFGDTSASTTNGFFFYLNGITNLRAGRNENVGFGINSLAPSFNSVTNELGVGEYKGIRTRWGTAAPTSGTWGVGDRTYNTAPGTNVPTMWLCTAAGTPGTWITISSPTFGTGLTNTAGNITNDAVTGIAGGGNVVGGTGSGENLTLKSTSNITKGAVKVGSIVFDEANTRVGIGTTPSQRLHISTNTNTNEGIYAENINAGNAAYAFLQLNSDVGNVLLTARSSGSSAWNKYATLLSSSGLTGGLAIGTGGSAPLEFYIAASKKGWFDTNGNFNLNLQVKMDATNTAAGTTGDRTINKPSGTVNIAASGTSVTVTNSLVTTSSIVYCVIRTNDATAKIRNVVPAAGSFTITLDAAATAETSIGFVVYN